MLRLEIFINRSVEENLLEAFKDEGVATAYSKIPVMHGVGRQGPRMGDAIWPEENIGFVIYCEAEEAEGIKRAVDSVKEKFPDEGIKVFTLGGNGASNLRYADAALQDSLPAPGGFAALPSPGTYPSGAYPPQAASRSSLVEGDDAAPGKALPGEGSKPQSSRGGSSTGGLGFGGEAV
jgi:hypothetical protein